MKFAKKLTQRRVQRKGVKHLWMTASLSQAQNVDQKWFLFFVSQFSVNHSIL